jgi:hypothetical protein
LARLEALSRKQGSTTPNPAISQPKIPQFTNTSKPTIPQPSSESVNLRDVEKSHQEFYDKAKKLEETTNYAGNRKSWNNKQGQLTFTALALYSATILRQDKNLSSKYKSREEELRKRLQALQSLITREQFSTFSYGVGTGGETIGSEDAGSNFTRMTYINQGYQNCCNYMISFYEGSPQCEDNWFNVCDLPFLT